MRQAVDHPRPHPERLVQRAGASCDGRGMESDYHAVRSSGGRTRGPDVPALHPPGPDDLPQLRPRLLLPAVLPALAHLPTVPPGHRPAPPHLPQQLSTGLCHPQAQGSSSLLFPVGWPGRDRSVPAQGLSSLNPVEGQGDPCSRTTGSGVGAAAVTPLSEQDRGSQLAVAIPAPPGASVSSSGEPRQCCPTQQGWWERRRALA